jgi:N-acyl-D-aspartate/D-glutamate deacylase
MPYDLLIRNAQILDGTGAQAFAGDVAVAGDRIAAVGWVDSGAKRVIDAGGQVLAPGFIDIHTHLDAQLLWDPLASSSCWHGITTAVLGNCSFGIAPCRPGDRHYLLKTLERVEGMSLPALEAGVDWSWETYPQYMDRIGQRLGINIAALVGHSAVRQYVMGHAAAERAATPDEIAAMQGVMREALDAGAWGMSFNFLPAHNGGDGRPIPCRLAGLDEVLAMAALMKGSRSGGRGGAIQVSDTLQGEDPLELCDRIGRASDCTVWWIPLLQFDSQPGVWKKRLLQSEAQVAAGSPARAMCTSRSVDIMFTMRNVHILDGMPAWKAMLVKPAEAVMADMRDPAVRAALRRDFDDKSNVIHFSRRWDMVEVIETREPALSRMQARKIADIAAEAGRDPLDVFLDLCVEDRLETVFLTVLANSDEAAAAEMLRHPDTLIGLSDAGAHAALECGYGFTTYLLGHWVRDKGIMPLEEAVRKLTSQLADQLGLADRGRICAGLKADLVLFDPATVNMLRPVPAFDLPGGGKRFVQKAEGISHTIVNGAVFMEHGEHAGSYAGRLLRRF